jgi:hypothetical protein
MQPAHSGWPEAEKAAAASQISGQMPALPAPTVPDAGVVRHTSMQPAIQLQSPGSIPDDLGSQPSRAPTLTAQMRSVQPPDVAKQALSELTVLARELVALPALLEANGLARTNRRTYFAAVQSYVGLARLAWEAVAEERLEQSGAEPEYRQQAIAVARRVSQLQQECRTLSANTEFQLPRKVPSQWRRRTRLARRGLNAFQDSIAAPPNALAMGRGLFALRGYAGLAAGRRFELGLLALLLSTTLSMLVIAGLGSAFAIAAALAGPGIVPAPAISLAVVIACAWLCTLLLGTHGPLPLDLVLGASIFSTTRSTRNIQPGAPLVAGLLRAWWIVVALLGWLATLGALALSIRGIVQAGAPAAPADPILATTLAANLLLAVFLPAAVVSFASVVLLALPVYLVTLLRSTAELAGGASWIAPARRYVLAPVLTSLVPVEAALLAGTWLATTAAGWPRDALYTLTLNGTALSLTPRALALFLVLVLPYALLVELPYRIGVAHWRRSWLRDLAERRADVESHVRRLSVPDPESGTQDTSDENLRAMQYDMVLLQFYQSKMEDVRRTPGGPYALGAVVFAIVVFAIVALGLDMAAAPLAQLVGSTIGPALARLIAR